MAELARQEARSAFRKLVFDSVPDPSIKTRVWQMIESIVFGAEPILRGLEHFEVRYGSGVPTPANYPKDGYGIWIDQSSGAAYVILQWRGSFFVIGGSGAGSLPAHTHSHLTEITNVGTNTHAQLDSHVADGTIHFLYSSIDHETILNVGVNTHAQLDTHVADGTIHFIEGAIDHTAILNVGSNAHSAIDSHIADGTIHFALPTIDYAYVSGLDAGTDISAAELEELSDGTSTALHTHANIGDGPWLPLSAGSGKALTGNLYIDKTSAPGIFMREGASAVDYSRIRDQGSGFYLQKFGATGAVLHFAAITNDGTSNVQMTLFAATNTTGDRDFDIYLGDGSATIQHRFRSKTGDVNLCQQGGQLTVGGTAGSQRLTVIGDASFTQVIKIGYLGGAPGGLTNGMIWMESDGFHFYSNGGETIVPGV